MRMRANFVGYYELPDDLDERRSAYEGRTDPTECGRYDIDQDPATAAAMCDTFELVSIEPVS